MNKPPSDRTVEGVGLWPLACWGCEFESRRGRGCLSVVSVACCRVEASASGRSFVLRSPPRVVCQCVMAKPRKDRS